jgi:hypothetical protein
MATGRIPTTANSPLTVKGDLFGYSTTQARVPVGNDGETLVADSSTTTGLRYTPTFSQAAGKNFIINGGFDIWQRGTSSATDSVYLPDRWFVRAIGTTTNSQDTDVPTSLGMRYSLKTLTGAGGSFGQTQYTHEQATTIPMRGIVHTFSWYMKVNSTWANQFNATIYYSNSSDARATVMAGTVVTATGNTAVTPTTSWARYSITFTVPTDAVGIGVFFAPLAVQSSGSAIWIAGCQWEQGSVATPFSRAGGTIQGELAACQRYYIRVGGQNLFQFLGFCSFYTTTLGNGSMTFPVTMRAAPTSIDFSTLRTNIPGAYVAITALTLNSANGTNNAAFDVTSSSQTVGLFGYIQANNSGSAHLGFSAEL